MAESIGDSPRRVLETSERVLDAKLIASIVATGLLSFLGVTVETAMNVTFPILQQEFAISVDQVQWVTTGYLLVLGVVIPTSAFLKRRFRTRSLFVAAVVIFLAGSVLAALTPNFTLLLVGRLLQAAGAGIGLPMMFNYIMDRAPFQHMGLLMGIGSLITALAPAVGPSFGGFVVGAFGWREIFVITIPVLLLALALGIWGLKQTGEISRPPFDLLGWVLIAAGFTFLVFASNLAASFGLVSLPVTGLIALSVVTLGLFSRHSLRSHTPLVDVRVFGNRVFVLASVIIVLVQFMTLGQGYLIPNYTQIVFGTDPFISGLLLMPGCAIGAVLAPLSGRILDRFGARSPLLFGSIGVLLAMLLFTVFFDHLGLIHIAAIYCVHTIGQGFTVGNALTTGLRDLGDRLRADGNAAVNTLQQMGGALGTGVTTSIIAVVGPEGARWAFALYAALGVVLLVCWYGMFSGPEHRPAARGR